jgi:hypothetical protein
MTGTIDARAEDRRAAVASSDALLEVAGVR